MAILDSCRDNPFPEGQAIVDLAGTPQVLRTGLMPQESPINSLLVFSTAPGAVALDGSGANSPFMEAFVGVAEARPGEPIDELMKDVRRQVYLATDSRQLPWDSSSLVEPVILKAASAPFPSTSLPEPASRPSGPVAIRDRFDRNVKLDAVLGATEGGGSVQTVAVAEAPARGRIELLRDGRSQGMPQGLPIPGGGIEGLIYRPPTADRPAAALEGIPAIEDVLVLQLDGVAQPVTLSLSVDPCDFHAGDHLDPDGMGFARYPNEIDVETALSACEAAVAGAPSNGRFRYQLGRVRLALRDLDGAERAFEAARERGHTRAWHALGTVAAARAQETGGAGSARMPDLALARFAEGVRLGDPYAYHSLGLQLLRHPRSLDETREGFALLSRALELGHTFAMNALGLYFLDPDADHHDAERGLRYLSESAERGDIYGFDNMGHATLAGLGGLAADPEAAREWFAKAAEAGHPTAPTSIGRLHATGRIGAGPDAAAAIGWYDIGLARGDGWGGANAAWLIANRTPPGYQPWDAAVRAAKAAVLRNREAAEAAEAVLAALPARALDGGVQALMRDLGTEIAVDGAFGPQSAAALTALAERAGRRMPGDRAGQLRELARMHWERTRFRIDPEGATAGSAGRTTGDGT